MPYEKLYQSELYTKHHWRIVGSILFILIIIEENLKGNIFLPRVVYFILAGILFVWQLAMIKVCEENVEKEKEYIEGLKWFLCVIILIVLSDMYLDLHTAIKNRGERCVFICFNI